MKDGEVRSSVATSEETRCCNTRALSFTLSQVTTFSTVTYESMKIRHLLLFTNRLHRERVVIIRQLCLQPQRKALDLTQ